MTTFCSTFFTFIIFCANLRDESLKGGCRDMAVRRGALRCASVSSRFHWTSRLRGRCSPRAVPGRRLPGSPCGRGFDKGSFVSQICDDDSAHLKSMVRAEFRKPVLFS